MSQESSSLIQCPLRHGTVLSLPEEIQMKQRSLCVVCLCLSLSGVAIAAEKKVQKSDLPSAVQKTAEEQSQGSDVRGYARDKEDGKLEYEIQMTSNGHSKDVTIAPDGQLMEVEEEVALDALTADVRTALQKKAGKGQITKIESLTKHGSVVAYEAQVQKTSGKHSEIQVGPHGEGLNHEE
jgi:hypothetical protein